MSPRLPIAALLLAFAWPTLPLLASESGTVLSDPTRPPATPEHDVAAARPELPRVSMLRLSGPQPLAVVNGRSVRVGDRLPLGTVRAIGPEGVVVATGDGDLTLPLASRVELDIRRSE